MDDKKARTDSGLLRIQALQEIARDRTQETMRRIEQEEDARAEWRRREVMSNNGR